MLRQLCCLLIGMIAWASFAATSLAKDGSQPEDLDQMEARLAQIESGGDTRSIAYRDLVEEVAIAHHERGVALSKTGDAAAATAHFRRAHDLDRASYSADDPAVLNSGNSLATNLNFLGNYSEAEAILRGLLLSADAVSAPGRRSRWTIVNTLAGSLTGQNRLRDAEALLREVRDQIAAQGTPNDNPLAILIANNLAHNLHEQRRYVEADALFREVTRRYHVAGADTPEAWLADHNLAANLIDMGQFEKALPLARSVLTRRTAAMGTDHPDSLTSQTIVGLALLGMGNRADAVATLDAALQGRRRKLGLNHPDTLLGEAALADALLRAPATAARASPLAAHVVEVLRDRMTARGFGIGDQSQFARDLDAARAAERQLIEAAWQSKLPDREQAAFVAAQIVLDGSTSRAVALKAANRSADAVGLSAVVEQRQKLSADWQAIDRRLLALAGSATATDLRAQQDLTSQRDAVAREVAAIDTKLSAASPDYFALIRPPALSIAQAKSLLGPDEAAIFVLPTEYSTHIFLLTHEGLTWKRSDWTDDRLKRQVTRLLWDVGAKVDIDPEQRAAWEREGDGAYPFDFVTAQAVYTEIIAPVATQFSGKRVLFISPAGSLASMPFGILVREIPTGANGDPVVLRSAKWFAEDIAQIQVPSLNSLAFLRRFRVDRDAVEARSFLGFGDPVLEGTSSRRGASRGPPSGIPTDIQRPGSDGIPASLADPGALRKLARLPGTAEELSALWSAAGAPPDALFLAGAATETRVRQTSLAADVIVFATHGLLAQELSGLTEPGLVLSPPATASLQDDGYLTSSEIAELRIRAKWVVLSACNTGGSDGANGEGLSGLARSFFFAGAPSLLVSHWPVRDAVAPKLTVAATRWLKNHPNGSPAEALQAAMKIVRDDISGDTDTDTWAHPNAWAPFITVGDR